MDLSQISSGDIFRCSLRLRVDRLRFCLFFPDSLLPILNIGIPERHIGIKGRLFERFIIPDGQGCVVHIFVSPDSERHIPGTYIRDRIQEIIARFMPGLSADELARRLRLDRACIFGRIEADRLRLDMRTVTDEQIPVIATALAGVASGA